MKLINIFLVFLMFLLSCNDAQKNSRAANEPTVETEQASFFPVTDFLYGQIAEIKNRGINPLKITTVNKHEDSSWLKIEVLNDEFAPFLSPVIDSSNLAGMFTEKKFLDQTINAFTFTYDPVKSLPDSFLLQRWDVYVDPASGTVRRIYMLKRSRDNKILQLTWQTNKSCRIITISKDLKGNDHVEKEVVIKWDF